MADDGCGLWLNRKPIADAELQAEFRAAFPVIRVEGDSATCRIIRRELKQGLNRLLGADVPFNSDPGTDAGLLVGTPASSELVRALPWADWLADLGGEGYAIRTVPGEGLGTLVLAAQTDLGLLYGAYHLLRILPVMSAWEPIDVSSRPRIRLRMLNHWDNLDGSIERGYAGKSLWDWDALPGTVDDRVIDYARANASIGINGVVPNSVNADPAILTGPYLAKVAALADAFRPYGIRVYLSANFASPIGTRFSLESSRRGGIGDLEHADPSDPAVRAWWKAKVEEIYRHIPDFGGFLVKANSEGMPGPQDYGLTHADGANMLAEALAPHGGVVIWRAFVYSPAGDPDRVKRAYLEFVPLDEQFASNVLVQAKNGPLDFQPREAVQPLFDAMAETPVTLELQITQEYLGHDKHLVYLAPMWKAYLDTDFAGDGSRTLADIVDGSATGHALTGIAGVANTGSDRNWTGHLFGQANWYAFGRLAWDHGLTPEQIADEWIRATFGADPQVAAVVKSMMLGSWEACVDYMTPLGLHHIMQEGHHHGPGPGHDTGARADWTSVYYHRADRQGLGFNRSSTGSNATAQYPPALRELYDQLETCPEELLLWFHHVPWTYETASGRTLWDELQHRYDRGVAAVDDMVEAWRTLQPRLDPDVYEHVASKLDIQQRNAREWRRTCMDYFAGFRNAAGAGSRGPGLAEAYWGAFRIGTAISDNQAAGLAPLATEIIAHDFNSLTTENVLKWSHVQPAPGRFGFEAADRFVEFGEARGMFLVGHTLAWHHQTPAWVFLDDEGGPVDRDTLMARLREHIATVVGRYRGRIDAWDVVNEAIDNQGNYRRNSPWIRILGEEFVARAFEFAHEADPDAKLYYNDYNMFYPEKARGVVRMVRGLQAQGVRIDGIGLQGHWGLEYPDLGQLEQAVSILAGAGIPLFVSELDVTVLPQPDGPQDAEITRRAAPRGDLNPYPDGLPEEMQEALAGRYAEIFSLFLRNRETFDRVTVWGVGDGQSWRSNWPVWGRTDYPLLFDRRYEAKPAYFAVKRLVDEEDEPK